MTIEVFLYSKDISQMGLTVIWMRDPQESFIPSIRQSNLEVTANIYNDAVSERDSEQCNVA